MKPFSYGFMQIVDLSFNAAIEKVKDELKKEGFGVLTQIDVSDTMKKKLNVEFRPYQILGACNPPNAYKSLLAEPNIGLMLPCNVIVYVNDDSETVIAAVDPVASMAAVQNPDLASVAGTIQNKLKKVIEGCASSI